MASWFDRYIWRRQPERQITTLEAYAAAVAQFMWSGNLYTAGDGVTQTLSGEPTEQVTHSLPGYAQAAYAGNGVVFACMAVRMLVFSSIRFTFQRFNQGRPSDLFSNPDLDLLHVPWVGGTVQDLLVRAIQDADLAGNFYATTHTPLPRLGGDGQREIVRLRPDWVQILLEERRLRGGTVGWRKAGYAYFDGGIHSGNDPVPLLPGEVVQFAPHPDPLATYRGMSWLTPVLREVMADGVMTRHKQRFFEAGATPNMIIKAPEGVKEEAFKKFVAEFNAAHRGGTDNAYKSLFLAPGADATVVGSNLQQVDFKTVQGAGETRIAAAAGVPPAILGISEGLQGSALNSGNYTAARRRFADGTAHPLWQNLAGSFSVLVPGPPGARLWYWAKDVPFLREDEKDAAEIALIRAQTYRQLVDSGWTPDSVKAYMLSGDEGLLTHSNLYSVQLQPPGTIAAPNGQVPALNGSSN